MSAPSKANISKLDNPARVTVNHRHGTELWVWGGNKSYEATGRAVCQPQCASVKVSSPEIFHNAQGQGVHFLETKISAHVMVRVYLTCRDLSP